MECQALSVVRVRRRCRMTVRTSHRALLKVGVAEREEAVQVALLMVDDCQLQTCDRSTPLSKLRTALLSMQNK